MDARLLVGLVLSALAIPGGAQAPAQKVDGISKAHKSQKLDGLNRDRNLKGQQKLDGLNKGRRAQGGDRKLDGLSRAQKSQGMK